MASKKKTRDLQFFLLLGAVYAALGVAVALALVLGGDYATIGFPVAIFLCITGLGVGSVWLRFQEAVRLRTAAINIQALGVFGLMLGICVTGSIMAHRSSGASVQIDFSQLVWPVIEGLLAAGWGLAFSTGLRTFEDIWFGDAGGSASGGAAGGYAGGAMGATPIGPAATALAAELTAGTREAEKMRVQMDEANKRLGGFITLLDQLGKLLSSLRTFFPTGRPGAGGA